MKLDSGINFVVASNCQTDGIAEALSIMLGGVHVGTAYLPFTHGESGELEASLTDWSGTLITSDSYCWTSDFAARHPKVTVIRLPQILFPAFHPDIVYAEDKDGRTLRCLDTDYHSAICLWSWKEGLSTRNAMGLFSDRTFHALGYMNAWEPSVKELHERFTRSSLDFGRFWRAVRRRLPFMYSVNHPDSFTLCELTKQIAVRLGAHNSIYDEPIDELLTDKLDAVRWPIYPALGRLYGVSSCYQWKVRRSFYLSLEEYISEAYRSYDAQCLSRAAVKVRSGGYDRFHKTMLGMAKGRE